MEIAHELISIVSKVSPILGSAIAGPAGAFVMSLISGMFGVSNADSDKLAQVISNDPDYEIKIKKIETDHIQNIRNIELQEYQLEVQDRDSARKYNIQNHDWVVTIIAIGYSTLYAILVILDALSIIPVKQAELLNLFSIAMIIVNYYLGSSHTERKRKQE